MNKKTKMALGLGVVAVAAYYFWKKAQDAKKTTAFANVVGVPAFGASAQRPSGLNKTGSALTYGR